MNEPNVHESPQAILVLGMHRSGTSAIAGTLVRLGASAPATLMPPHPDNERGFFESTLIMQLNDRILAELGSSWSDWRRFPFDWRHLPGMETWKAECKSAISNEFAGRSLFLFKDPRVSRLFPLWADVLLDLSIGVRSVIALRSPIEVARSLTVRNGISTTETLLVWLRYLLECEKSTRTMPRSIVPFDELLLDWRSTVDRVAREIGIGWPRLDEQAGADIDSFLSLELRHQDSARDGEADVPKWVEDAYRALQALARDPNCAASQDSLDGIAVQFEAACALFEPLIPAKPDPPANAATSGPVVEPPSPPP